MLKKDSYGNHVQQPQRPSPDHLLINELDILTKDGVREETFNDPTPYEPP